MKKFVYILILLTIIYSCGKESKCIKSTGANTTEYRQLDGNINSIKIENNINLTLKQDTFLSATVSAGNNLLKHIITEVKGNKLEIKNENKCNFLRSLKKKVNITLTLPNLNTLEYEGSGYINCIDTLVFSNLNIITHDGSGTVDITIKSDNFNIYEHTGPADFIIKGKVNNLYAYTGGNGWFSLSNLKANHAHINTNGTGDVHVKATNSLLAEIYSIGNIDYYGNPQKVNLSVRSGSGQLRKKE